jgi:hypothetical protein
MMHANETPEHPRDPSLRILHPRLESRTENLATRHFLQFPGNVLEGTADPVLRFGQRYFRLDSPEGAMVRAARGHHVNKEVAHVGGPVEAIEVERVPAKDGKADLAALAEVERDWIKQGT